MGGSQFHGWSRTGRLRPVVVISRDEFNAKSGTVIALAITSQPPNVGFPLAVEITSLAMPKRSWVKTGQIRTLSLARFGSHIGRLDEAEMVRIKDALDMLIDR